MPPSDGLPLGLRWEVEPRSWRLQGDAVEVLAAGRTDYFVDPARTVEALNAARASAVAPRPGWRFSARVAVDFQAEYDAGVLLLWSDESHFAKLCFEQSPRGRPMVVSVVTRGLSDDANGWIIDGDSVELRITCVADKVYAFHARENGSAWQLVRYFELAGSQDMRYGIAAQSPVGSGCTVTFSDLAFVNTGLSDIRDGS